MLREASNAPVLYGWHDGRARHFGRGVIRIGLASDAADPRSLEVPPASRDLPARIVTFGPRDFHQILKAKFGLADR